MAGSGEGGFYGDGGPATSARLSYPVGVAVDPAGNLYIADRHNFASAASRRLGHEYTGIISTVAGNGYALVFGRWRSRHLCSARRADGVAVDGAGNLYFAD